MGLEKIVVVKKRTPLEELLVRHGTTSQVRFYLESRGESYSFYKDADEAYRGGLSSTLKSIPSSLKSQVIDKGDLATFQFSNRDLVVVVGDPGLFVNVAKYTREQPIITVNPDQQRFNDIFTSCIPQHFDGLLKKVLNEEAGYERLTLAEATLEDGQKLLALNEFFIGRKTHVSARYQIEYGGKRERQSSSGLIVLTGTGSTGWFTSIMLGAYELARKRSSNVEMEEDLDPKEINFLRDSNYLMFAVREPFPSKVTGTNIVYGKVTDSYRLKVTSNMPEEGVIFSDGIESDFIEFNAGHTVTIAPAKQKACRVVGINYT